MTPTHTQVLAHCGWEGQGSEQIAGGAHWPGWEEGATRKESMGMGWGEGGLQAQSPFSSCNAAKAKSGCPVFPIQTCLTPPPQAGKEHGEKGGEKGGTLDS